MAKINKAAIFCGSKAGANPLYHQHAVEVALLLAQHGVELIYGGGRNGLMGAVADTVMQAGGIVRGVIPQVLSNREHQHDGISELLIVEDMHVRKRKLYELCDAAIILPGGFGTLDELFEIVTWNNLAIHDKLVFILNSDGFYNHLLQHLQRVAADGFMYGGLEEMTTVVSTPQELVEHLTQ